jgi:predicted flavoprotein YhiN
VEWPAEFLAQAEGLPLKNVVVRAGVESVAGELLITKYGLEGGALYQLGRTLRGMERLEISVDLKPSFSREALWAKFLGGGSTAVKVEEVVRTWRLSSAAEALLRRHPQARTVADFARLAKIYPIGLCGPRPIEEAISTAGGVKWAELDDDLMLKACPGVSCAGEMIDWDAPTGGYLIQGCFSTATRAARGSLKFLTE